MKTCIYCKENKDDDCFHPRYDQPGKFRNSCKKCDSIKHSTWIRNKWKTDKDFKQKMLDCNKKRKANNNNYDFKKWVSKNKIKRTAHLIFNRYLRSNKIIKPKTCEYCGEIKRLQAHHADYNKPLIVFWLCAQCHSDIHRRCNDLGFNKIFSKNVI